MRAFPLFPLGQSSELDEFHKWLQGMEGKARTVAQVTEIAVDVSKALWFNNVYQIDQWLSKQLMATEWSCLHQNLLTLRYVKS